MSQDHRRARAGDPHLAAKRQFGENRDMEAKYNPETGSVDLFLIINVVEDDAIEGREITVEDATRVGLEADLGDELLFQVFYRVEDAERASEQDEKFGNLIDLKAAHKNFGRIAAQTAKQVIFQRVREAERDNVYNEYKDRKGEIVTGTIRRFERGASVVDLGKAEAVLPMREQVPRESFRSRRQHQGLLPRHRSRRPRPADHPVAHPQGPAREALRAGGPRDLRRRSSASSRRRASLAPAPRSRAVARSRRRPGRRLRRHEGLGGSTRSCRSRAARRSDIAYDDDLLGSCAQRDRAGRGVARDHRRRGPPDGAHRRRRSALARHRPQGPERAAGQAPTGWRIDIHSESKIYELERRAKEQIGAIAGISPELAETLFKLGWRSVTELARGHVEELAGVPGVGGVEGAQKVIEGAAEYLAGATRRKDEMRREAERRSALSGEAQLLEIGGIDEEILPILKSANVHSPEDLIKTPIDQVANVTGIDMSDLAKLRQRVMTWLAEVSS
ncbi:MAG: NusA N-terminal domain-containing protein [Kofleriaceae bacterium]